MNTAVLARVLRLGAELAEGNVPDTSAIVRELIGLGLDLVPVEELRVHLDAEAARRADAIVDAVVDRKFPRA